MRIGYFFLLFSIFYTLFKCEAVDLKDTEVVLVIQTIRHGARYPIYYFKGVDKEKLGELSEVGMRQLFELGRIMRKKYIIDSQLLSEKYNQSELYVRSTDKTRTLTSAQSFLAGLYPQNTGPTIPLMNKEDQMQYFLPPHQLPQNFESFSGDGSIENRFQPIPIHTVDFQLDTFLVIGQKGICQSLEDLREQYQNGEEMRQLNTLFKKELEEFNKLIQEQEGRQLDIIDIHRYVDNLICDEFNNKGLPKGWKTNKEFSEKMKDIITLVFYIYYFGNEEISKLSITPYFVQILEFLDKKIIQKQNPKYYALFTHDVTIINILVALKQASWECLQQNIINNKISPDCSNYHSNFASDITFELRFHQKTNQYILVTLFNGKIIQLQKGRDYLLYKEFKQLLEDQIEKEYDKKCSDQNKRDFFNLGYYEKFLYDFKQIPSTVMYIITILICLLMVLIVFTSYLVQKLKKYEQSLKNLKQKND